MPSKTYTIIIPGCPIPLKRARITTIRGYPRVYDSQIAEKNIMAGQMLDQLSPEAQEDIKQADYCTISFRYLLPYPSDRKLRQLAKWGLLKHTTRPDLSNLNKMNEDVAQNCILNNDSMITSILHNNKAYDSVPRTIMEITPHKYPKLTDKAKAISNLFDPEDIIVIAAAAINAKEAATAILKLTEAIDLDNEAIEKAVASLVDNFDVLAQYADKLQKYNKQLKKQQQA